MFWQFDTMYILEQLASRDRSGKCFMFLKYAIAYLLLREEREVAPLRTSQLKSFNVDFHNTNFNVVCQSHGPVLTRQQRLAILRNQCVPVIKR